MQIMGLETALRDRLTRALQEAGHPEEVVQTETEAKLPEAERVFWTKFREVRREGLPHIVAIQEGLEAVSAWAAS